MIFKSIGAEIIPIIVIFKYFFGFLVFYAVFSQKWAFPRISSGQLLLILSSVVILDALLINTILPFQMIPSYVNSDGALFDHTPFFGFYHRPHSFAESSSSLGGQLTALLALYHQQQHNHSRAKFFVYSTGCLAILLAISGTGYFLFALFIFITLAKKNIRALTLFFAISLLIYSTIFGVFYRNITDYTSLFLYKISPQYAFTLLKGKLSLVDTHFLHSTITEVLFGKSYSSISSLPIYGDFGWFDFLRAGGLIGMLLFLALTIKEATRKTIIPIIISLIGTFHYSPIFTFSGQIIFAYILCFPNSKKDET